MDTHPDPELPQSTTCSNCGLPSSQPHNFMTVCIRELRAQNGDLRLQNEEQRNNFKRLQARVRGLEAEIARLEKFEWSVGSDRT